MIIKLVGSGSDFFNIVTLIRTIRSDEKITLGRNIDLKTGKFLADKLLMFEEVVFEPTEAHMQSLSEIEIHLICDVPNLYRVVSIN